MHKKYENVVRNTQSNQPTNEPSYVSIMRNRTNAEQQTQGTNKPKDKTKHLKTRSLDK